MNCYGHYKSCETCRQCEYCQSCQMYTATEDRMEVRFHHQCYEDIAHFALDAADYSSIPGNEEDEDVSFGNLEELNIILTRKMSEFLVFLVSLDDYDLGIIREIISPTIGHTPNVAELARIRHISRQAMHRKIIDLAKARPELRDLLKCVLLKLRKNPAAFELSRTKTILESKKQQLELF